MEPRGTPDSLATLTAGLLAFRLLLAAAEILRIEREVAGRSREVIGAGVASSAKARMSPAKCDRSRPERPTGCHAAPGVMCRTEASGEPRRAAGEPRRF